MPLFFSETSVKPVVWLFKKNMSGKHDLLGKEIQCFILTHFSRY